jgi:parvulin-like peptidyl-prolyl isomerase
MSLNSFGNKLRTGPLGYIFFGIVLLCFGVLAFTGLGTNLANKPAPTGQQAQSDVLAKVDGSPITVAAFQGALEQSKEEASAYGPPPSVIQSSELRAQAFNTIIEPILAAKIAKERGLTVSDVDFQAARNKQLAQIRTELGLPSTASEDDISSALAANGVQLSDILNDEEIRNQLMAEAYQTDVTDRSVATDAAVRKSFEQVQARHILISDRSHPQAQALLEANQIIAKLNAGANFAALAKQYSDDPMTKNSGGSDGFVGQSSMYGQPFVDAVFSLRPQQITSQPVYSPGFGYFVIQAQAIKPNLPKDYLKNHQNYASKVSQTLVQQTEESDLAAEKAKASIVIIDPRLKGDVALSMVQPSDPNRTSVLQGVITDYNSALKNGDESDKAEIHASLAVAYHYLNDTNDELEQVKLALADVVDSELYVILGDLYKQKGDVPDALVEYKSASDHAYSDPQVHEELQQDYKLLKLPALAQQQNAWLASFYSRQRSAMASPSLTPQQ